MKAPPSVRIRDLATGCFDPCHCDPDPDGVIMKSILTTVLLASCFPSLVCARNVERMVASGQSSMVGRYFTWKADCSSAFGTVKVISKPQHGTISNHLVDTQIGTSRRKGRPDQCFGKPIRALAVFYKSQPGYHGIDSFSLDATFDRYRDLDTFTINVQ
jgi:hypothetical protein